MERLIVKNFGPLKDVDIELKDVNLFIGPTGSGKSTIAKLVAIFNHRTFRLSDKTEDFTTQVDNYELNIYFKKNETYIEYQIDDYVWTYKNEKIKTNYPLAGVDISTFNLSPIARESQNPDKVGIVYLTPFLISETFEELNKIKLEYIENYDAQRTINKVLEDISYYKSKFEEQSEKPNLIEISKNEFELLLYNISLVRLYIFTIALDAEAILIPAERMFYSTFNSALKSILLQEIPIPVFLNLFGRAFDFALDMNKGTYEIEDLKLKIAKSEKGLIFIDIDNNLTLPLQVTASGIQSMTPAATVIGYWKQSQKKKNRNVIIEEPELNLFPSTQYDFLKFILKGYKNTHLKTLITTHSPYILSALDNLILAHNVAMEKGSNDDEIFKQIENIIPMDCWVNYDDVAAYYCANGEVKPILDKERRGIAGNEIDAVSEVLGKEFDELTTLRYAEK